MKTSPLPAMALLLALLLAAPTVPADDEWEDDERRLEIEQSDDGFELRSDRFEGAAHDRIRLRLDGDAVEFRFELTEQNATEAEAGLRVQLEEVLEFEDEDGDGRLGDGDDVRRDYDLGDFGLVGIDVANVTADGVDGVQITANYAFVDFPASTLGFRVTAFGDLATFQGIDLTPVEMKLDLLFDDFPFTEEDTLPAIALEVKADSVTAPNLTGDQVSFTTGNLTAVFAWAGNATVDGLDTSVGITAVPQEAIGTETETLVTFAYARGSDIVHDPTFAFLGRPGEGGGPPGPLGEVLGNLVFYAIGALAAAGVFAVAYVFRGRRVKPG